MKKRVICLIIAIALIIAGCAIARGVDTDFGKVNSDRISLVDSDGYKVSANLYTPANVSGDQKLPAMIIVPGGDSPSDFVSSWSLEIARRGYIVATADYSGSGFTELNPAQEYFSAGGAMGIDTIYDYLAGLSFVDPDQIGVAGHSMGSLYSYRLSTMRKVSMVVADVVFDDAMPDYNFNFFQISGTHDEGLLSRTGTFEGMYELPFLTEIFGTKVIEPNKVYGSWEENNVRAFYTTNDTHRDLMISGSFITALLDSVMNTMDAPNPIDANDHIYGGKIAGLTIALLGLIIFMFAFAGLLIDSSLFSSLKLAKPERQVGYEYKSKKWWIWCAVMALIPLVTFLPATGLGTRTQSTKLFQLGTTPNAYLVWSLVTAVVLLIAFIIFHVTYGKKNGGNLYTYGFSTVSGENTIRISYILKSALLALILFLTGYFIIMLVYQYANTDIHIWMLSFRPIEGERNVTLPWYTLAYIPFFLVMMLAGKGLGFKEDASEGRGMVKSIIIGICAGMVGLALLLIAYNVALRGASVLLYTQNFAFYFMGLLQCMIPLFGVSMGLAMYIGKKLNSNYVGVFLAPAIAAFATVATNSLGIIISANVGN